MKLYQVIETGDLMLAWEATPVVGSHTRGIYIHWGLTIKHSVCYTDYKLKLVPNYGEDLSTQLISIYNLDMRSL